MSYFDDASLVMIPSGYKTSKVYSVKPTDGTGDLAFTRSNDTATRVASNGLIEKVRTNLVLSSNNISTQSTYWNANQSGVTTQNSAAAPDGTTTAALITPDGVSTYSGVIQAKTLTAVSNTYSVYLKTNSGTANVNVLAIDSASTFYGLTAITINTTWTRYTLTFTPAAGAGNIYITSSGSTAWLAWGAQLETSDIATDLIATTTAAVSVGPVANVPRLDYLNSTCPKLILEPQRSNLATFSESFDNAAWTKAGVTITANATTSPDGYTNADKLVADAAAGDKYANQILTVTNGVAYTSSAYFKASEYTYAFMRLGGITGNPYVIYNLATQAVVATSGLTTSTITSVGNGWYRVTATATQTSTTLAPVLMVLPTTGYTLSASNLPQFTGNGTSGGFVWGCQSELGSYATSYIPTLGASVTRGADAASKTGISSLIGQTEGTLFTEFEHNGADILTAQQSLNISSGNTQNYVVLSVYDGRLNPAVKASNVNIFDTLVGPNPLSSGTHKVAIAYKSEDFAVYIDGVSVYTSSATATFATMSQVEVGNLLSFTTQLGGGVSQALLFKTRLSNADLAALTA